MLALPCLACIQAYHSEILLWERLGDTALWALGYVRIHGEIPYHYRRQTTSNTFFTAYSLVTYAAKDKWKIVKGCWKELRGALSLYASLLARRGRGWLDRFESRLPALCFHFDTSGPYFADLTRHFRVTIVNNLAWLVWHCSSERNPQIES